MRTKPRSKQFERELACIIVAHDAIGQVVEKTTNMDDIDIYDRMIVTAHRKMEFIMKLYLGSASMRNAAKIAMHAYEREGKKKPNAMIFALTVIGSAFDKTGMRHFPVATVSSLCDMFDTVAGYVDDIRTIKEAVEYGEAIASRIFRSDADHIQDDILEAS